jgi:GDP-4-dehydro-6-deoxy-D-mannose reductase
MTRVLITGIAGFIGRHVAACARAKGHDVLGLDLVHSPTHPSAVVDLSDGPAVRNVIARFIPDIVIHLAGQLRASEPQRLYEANVLATATLLDALVAEHVSPNVLVASSSAVYGASGEEPIDEQRQLRPMTHYAASKAAQELVAFRYHYARLLPIVVARAFNVIGPGQPAILSASAFAQQIARAERSGSDVRVGSLTAVRDFVDVRDVARAYVALAALAPEGSAYNICSGVGVPMSRCLEVLLSLARRPIAVQHEDSLTQAHDVPVQVGDSTRLRREAGWKPEVSLEQSLADLLEDWRRRTEGIA